MVLPLDAFLATGTAVGVEASRSLRLRVFSSFLMSFRSGLRSSF